MHRVATIGIGLVLLLVLLGFALVITSRVFDGHSLPSAPPPNHVILDNVNIIPISVDGVQKRQKITVEHGRIRAIETAGPPYEPGLEILDLDGGYLIPGLVDMHVHIDDREQLRLALSYGVTAVRNMDGMPIHLRWMDELKNYKWLGSRLYSTSPILHGENYSSAIDVVVRDEGHARELSAQLRDEGWDFTKIYSGLGIAEFRALLDESAKTGLPVVGHVPYEIVAEDYSLAAEMLTVEHVEEIFQGPLQHSYDTGQLDIAIATLAKANAFVCPTLSTFENLTRLSVEKSEYLAMLPTGHMTRFGEFFRRKVDIDRWLNVSTERGEYNTRELDFLKFIVKKLDESKVRLILGTDSGTNFVLTGPSLWQEMQLMLDAGLEPRSILRSATIYSATALNIANDYGSIEVGKLADFVLVESNPLEDLSVIESVAGVFVEGNYLDQNSLIALRNGQDEVAGWWLSVARYFEAFFVRMTGY